MTQAAQPFGSCLATLPNAQGQIDLTPDMQVATGVQVLAQSLVRRQTTPRGSVLTSPNDCIDVRMYLSKGLSQSQVAALAQTIRGELLRDQRVLAASVSIALTVDGTMTITETILASAGPFTLTLTLTASTINVIVAGQ